MIPRTAKTIAMVYTKTVGIDFNFYLKFSYLMNFVLSIISIMCHAGCVIEYQLMDKQELNNNNFVKDNLNNTLQGYDNQMWSEGTNLQKIFVNNSVPLSNEKCN